MTEIIATLGIGIGVVAGGLEIWRHFRRTPSIVNPTDGAECGGLYVEVSGAVLRRKRRAEYWVAIQPSDCRGSGTWWPQRHRLTFGRKGTWILQRATLGRVGTADIGCTYTIGLFEVLPKAHAKFSQKALEGERLKLADVSESCNQLCTIEVKRVRE